jgi:DNA-binding NtrC family response regulator
VITADALQLLSAFQWPGNIRQLENAVFRSVVLAEGDQLGIAEFPQIMAQFNGPAAGLTPAKPEQPPGEDNHEAVRAALVDDYPMTLPAPDAPVLIDALPLLDGSGEVRPLEAIEADLIRYAITHYRGQMSEVARRLQIGRSTLYRKLEALGLNGKLCGEAEAESAESVAAERQPRKIA